MCASEPGRAAPGLVPSLECGKRTLADHKSCGGSILGPQRCALRDYRGVTAVFPTVRCCFHYEHRVTGQCEECEHRGHAHLQCMPPTILTVIYFLWVTFRLIEQRRDCSEPSHLSLHDPPRFPAGGNNHRGVTYVSVWREQQPTCPLNCDGLGGGRCVAPFHFPSLIYCSVSPTRRIYF